MLMNYFYIVKNKMSEMMLTKIIGILTNVIITFYIAKEMGLETFGKWIYLQTLVMIFYQPVCDGYKRYLIRETSKNKNYRFSVIIKESFKINMILLIVLLLIDLLFELECQLLYMGIINSAMIMNFFISGILNGKKLYIQSMLAESILKPIIILIGLGLLHFISDEKLSIKSYMWIIFFTGICTFIYSIILFKKYMSRSDENLKNELQIVGNSSSIIVLTSGKRNLINNITVLILGYYEENIIIGSLKIIERIIQPLIMIQTILSNYQMPLISNNYKENGYLKNEIKIKRKTKQVTLLCVILTVFLFAISYIINEYDYYKLPEDYMYAMLILSISTIVNVSFGIVGNLILMINEEKKLANFYLYYIILIIPLSYFVINENRFWGALLIMFINNVLINLVLYLYLKIRKKVDISIYG